MTLYAIDAIDDAFAASRSLLWPPVVGRWLRLALIVFFLGGIGGGNPLQFGGSIPSGEVSDGPGGPEMPAVLPSFSAPELALIGAVVALLFLIGLAFLFIGSVMEFVFVEALRTTEVTIRRSWRAQWRRGLRLFGFRLLVGLVTLGILGFLIAAVVAPAVLGNETVAIGLVLIALPIGLLVAVTSGLLYGFTTMFVVPIMMQEDRGVLSAWRRLWPTVTAQVKQYAAYAVIGFLLQIAGGIVAGMATGIGAFAVAIPLGIIGLVGAGLLQVSELLGLAVIAFAAVLFVLALLMLIVIISVPVKTFLRYHALLVLGDTNESLDVIAEQRQAVRS